MKFNNSNKLVLSFLLVIASVFLSYWAIVFWMFNNWTLHEGQSSLNRASIISTLIAIFIFVVTIASIFFFIKNLLKTINNKKWKTET
ncbi:hypothetical protein [Flavobacterium sp. 5]|uniref:hypothetical protein n=1 Tax=Flavobacterium sp. 5 TaxID=2035199 RepID=UPI0012FD8F38|nr:hypothetical protein [Flavobacterium sp. 5]